MFWVLPLLFVTVLTACAGAPSVYTGLASGEQVDFEGLVEGIGDRRVIFIGEAHDSMRDHAVQLAIIRWLVESGKEVSVALEMFTPPDQGVLNAWVLGMVDEFEFYERYAEAWEMPYENYQAIFRYARRNAIPLYGINADRRLVRTIAREGLQGIPSEVLRMLKFTPCSNDPAYASAIGMAGMKGEHGGGMSHLCDAQRFRDSMLAYNLSQILTADRKGSLVVLLGTGHAVKQAVPSLLATHTDVPFVVLVPGEIRMLSGIEPGPDTADFVW